MRIVWASGLALVLAGCGVGAPFTESDRAAIMEQRTQFIEAVNLGDWTAATGVYHEDAVVQPPNSPRLNGKIAVKEFLESLPAMGQFKLYGEEVTPAGDYAMITGRYSLVVLPPGSQVAVPDTGKFVEIWTREGDGAGPWRMIHDTWNSDLPVPPPSPLPPGS